jgi:hypothetical protein
MIGPRILSSRTQPLVQEHGEGRICCSRLSIFFKNGLRGDDHERYSLSAARALLMSYIHNVAARLGQWKLAL